MLRILGLLLVSFVTGCASTSNIPVNNNTATHMTAMQAIEKAANNPKHGVRGTFGLKVKASGGKRKAIFLNSELDYRDPRSITIAIFPNVVNKFIKLYGKSPDEYFKNKNILVTGVAKKVKIALMCNGKWNKNEYYYQTHIGVGSVEQIKVVN